jgi:hypothetical protein
MQSKRSKKDRRFTGTSRNRPDMLKKRQAEALGRNDAYQELSVQQKLAALPPAPLCAKQRAKLQALLDGKKPAVKAVQVVQPETKTEEVV